MHMIIHPCPSPDVGFANNIVQNWPDYVSADSGSRALTRQNSGYDSSHRGNVGTFVNLNVMFDRVFYFICYSQ